VVAAASVDFQLFYTAAAAAADISHRDRRFN